MKHKAFSPILIVVFLALAALLVVFFSTSTKIELKLIQSAYHTDFYREAEDTWRAKLRTLPFKRQTDDEVIVGSPNRLTLKWEKPRFKYNHFSITVSDPATGWSRMESGEHERVSLDLDDLEPATEYVFVVRACYDPSCTEWAVPDKEAHGTTEPEPETTP